MAIHGISYTAWLVAACQPALNKTKRWQALVAENDAAFYRRCLDYCRTQSSLYRLLDAFPGGLHVWLVDRALARGAAQHYALRKRAIAEQVTAGVTGGAEQLVVIGAGFDALALGMARKQPGLRCFEIDIPAMQAHKLNAARGFFGELPGNFFAVAADLSRVSLARALGDYPAFDRRRPTLFVAEGLTMYLSEANVIALLADVRRLCERAPSLVFTAIERAREQNAGWGGWLRRFSLAASGEHFYWSMPRAGMADFLKANGFLPQRIFSYADLQRPWRTPEEMAVIEQQNGEYLVYAVANE